MTIDLRPMQGALPAMTDPVRHPMPDIAALTARAALGLTPATTIVVHGNGGTLSVNWDGLVAGYLQSFDVERGDHDGYGDIAAIDVAEFRAYYKLAELPSSIDILNVGYWTVDGYYEPAEQEFRTMLKDNDR